MAEHHQYQQPQHHTTDTIKSFLPEKSPSTPQVLAVVTLFPLGGVFLFLAGITLAGTLICLTVALPLFVIFSPIIVPALLTLALAVTGILTSGAFGITALSSVSWIINYMRRMRAKLPEHMEHAQRRVQDTVGHVGQKVRDAGQKTQDVARS